MGAKAVLRTAYSNQKSYKSYKGHETCRLNFWFLNEFNSRGQLAHMGERSLHKVCDSRDCGSNHAVHQSFVSSAQNNLQNV